ncbi:GGDEF domain-containing protein [Colwellia sp. BRX10-9]|uniref:tetratricopeptide repeat-containing diguanylate cyclase n=1 Tax=Colwellia sp. BRX10-9 TaxID=2759839 RepID=UPI0015F37E75|nr:GGDEF domain-containing protein [Colwellia sp. BRX10-9]MBA6383210.1 GGDEF domain-containing protein [Colwellia sp. BRX10-9]
MYKLKKLLVNFVLLSIFALSLRAFASMEEIQPFVSLHKSQLGRLLLKAESKYAINPKKTLEQLEQLELLKASETWENTPIINAKYYILKIQIQRAMSSPQEENIAVEELTKYAEEKNIDWLMLEANYQKANIDLSRDGNTNSVYNIIENTLQAAININFNHLVGRLYNLRAIYKQSSGDNSGALKDYYLAFDALTQYPNEDWTVKIYSNMSIIYLEIEDFTKGLQINELAFQLYDDQKIDNIQLKTSLLIMKALFLRNIGKIDEATSTLYLAKESAIKSGSINLILNVKNNLSGVLLQTKNINEAKKEVQECIDDSIKYGVTSVLHHCRSNLGHIEIELGHYSSAIELLIDAKDSFEKQNNIKAMIQQQLSLSIAYERSGDYQKALIQLRSYYEKHVELMFNERVKEVAEINESYEAKLKDKQITLLQINNDLQSSKLSERTLSNKLLILVSIFSVIVLFVLVSRYFSIWKYKNKLEKSNTKLLESSLIDPLTKLGNRRALTEYIKVFDAKSSKEETDYCIVIIDIDHFKQVNDTYGHGVGDEVLVIIAKLLSTKIRESDILVRWGGEEFVLVIEKKQQVNELSMVNRIIQTISNETIKTTMGDLNITISAGATTVSTCNINSNEWPEILDRVDSALYKAKKNGRNQAVMV